VNIDLKTPPIAPTRWTITRPEMTRQFPQGFIVVCVCYGTKYPNSYVHRLRNAVAKHLPIDHEFVCLSDREIEGIKTIPLPQLDKRAEGWWQKINLFHPGLFPDGARMLYLDLDVVITGDLSILAMQWKAEPLAMIYNFGPNRGHCAHNSSVMLWTSNDERVHPIWLEYQRNAPTIMKALHGDQCWIWRVLRDNVANFPRDYIASYKYDVRGKAVDLQTRVVVFHGNPKPDQCREPWVRDNWYNLLPDQAAS
jgi:hypothetical protein